MCPLGSLEDHMRAAWPGGAVRQEPALRAVAMGTYLESSRAPLPAVCVSIYHVFCCLQHFTPVTPQLLCALQAVLNKEYHQVKSCINFFSRLSSTCKVWQYLGVSSKAHSSGARASRLGSWESRPPTLPTDTEF